MATFYLLRHAHAFWTPNENRRLSEQGNRDAIRMADILVEYSVDIIYSSPSTRAFQTITPLAELLGIQIHIEPDLRERKLGEEKFEDFFGAVEATWHDPTFAHPGRESSTEAQKRGMAVVKQLQAKHPEDAIVLSTHGNLMALILQGFDPKIDFALWKSLSMPDAYKLKSHSSKKETIQRLWQDIESSYAELLKN